MDSLAGIRRHFPALRGDAPAYLDGAGGTQVPDRVIAAVAESWATGLGNVGGAFEASARSGRIVEAARGAVADLLGGDPRGVVLGPNATTLTYRLANALAATWRPGDEVVVSQLDHDANIRPWVQAAARVGAVIRWARVDPATGELPAEQYDDLVGERTRLVALTAASNLLGSIPDVARITAVAHEVGALTFVDAVAAAPHLPLDMAALGADLCSTSAYKWCGPHLGAVCADPDLLETLRPDKLLPSSDRVPNRFETGTHAFAQLAGLVAAVDFLADCAGDPGGASGADWADGVDHVSRADGADGADHVDRADRADCAGDADRADRPDRPGRASDGRRRERLLAGMAAIRGHEDGLLAALLDDLAARPGIEVVGRPAHRTPVVLFRAARHSPAEVAAFLGGGGVNVWHGHAYAWELVHALGLGEDGGVRVSLAAYTSGDDLGRLSAGLDALGYPSAGAGGREEGR